MSCRLVCTLSLCGCFILAIDYVVSGGQHVTEPLYREGSEMLWNATSSMNSSLHDFIEYTNREVSRIQSCFKHPFEQPLETLHCVVYIVYIFIAIFMMWACYILMCPVESRATVSNRRQNVIHITTPYHPI